MRTYNQTKRDHLQKRVLAFFMMLVLCVTMLPAGLAVAATEEPVMQTVTPYAVGKTIYTEFKSGNSNHSGDGSYANPYNLFEDAYAAASDGDVIEILTNGAFLNAEAAEPFVIQKSITINGNGHEFSNRKGGLVLDADVTFTNVRLGFANRLHDAIFANGHKLTLVNVSCESGSRYVDIFGGTLYMDGQQSGANPGNHAQITITGGGKNLGNIYAGAMNGAYDGSTDIVMEHVEETQNGEVYASGAKEPYVNLDSWFDIKEPDAPTAGADYTVSGNVTITLTDCDTRNVYGVSDDLASRTALTINTAGKYMGIPSVSNIGSLNVKGGGTFAPAVLDACRVSLSEASAIDLSRITNPVVTSIACEDSENNKLILDKKQTLEVTDTITGTLAFETLNGRNNKSGMAEYDHTYLQLRNKTLGTVSFKPSDGQSDMTLEQEDIGTGENWKTSKAKGYEPVAVNGLTVQNPVLSLTVSEVSTGTGYGGKEVEPFLVLIDWSEGTSDENQALYNVPIEYKVEFNGNTYYNDESDSIPDLHLTFTATTDERNIHSITPSIYMDGGPDKPIPPAEGIYYITIRPFSAGEQIEQKVTLIVNKDIDTSDPSITSQETKTAVSANAGSVCMQDQIELTVQTSYTDPALGQAVPDAAVSLYINQKKYDASDLKTANGAATLQIPVTEDNGFHVGDNSVLVLYAGAADGSYLALPSQANLTVHVNALTVALQYDRINQTAVYTGGERSCTIPTVNVVRTGTDSVIEANVQPVVFYQQNGTEVAPVLPGSYEVWFEVAGNGYDTLKEAAGTFTITAATPGVDLSADQGKDGSVQLNAIVKRTGSGAVPVGYVSFYQDGRQIGQRQQLRYGEASLKVDGLDQGNTYHFYAVYEPEYAGGVAYYEPVNSTEIAVTITAAAEPEQPGNGGDNKPDNGNTPGGDSKPDNGNTPGGDSSSGGTTGGGSTGGGTIIGGGSSTGSGTATGGGSSTDSGNTADSGNSTKDDMAAGDENTSDNDNADTKVPTINATTTNNKDTVKAKVTSDLIDQVVASNDGKHTDVKVEVVDKKGDVSYTLTVNTADVKKGKQLYLCEKDQKTGAYVIISDKSYTVSKAGNVNVSAAPGRDYVLLNRSDMNQVTAEVLKTVALKDNKLVIDTGKKSKVSLSKTLNMDNVKSISYKSSDRSVVTVDKKGTVHGKSKGTATVQVTVTLNNGKVKVLKLKVHAKVRRQ